MGVSFIAWTLGLRSGCYAALTQLYPGTQGQFIISGVNLKRKSILSGRKTKVAGAVVTQLSITSILDNDCPLRKRQGLAIIDICSECIDYCMPQSPYRLLPAKGMRDTPGALWWT